MTDGPTMHLHTPEHKHKESNCRVRMYVWPRKQCAEQFKERMCAKLPGYLTLVNTWADSKTRGGQRGKAREKPGRNIP